MGLMQQKKLFWLNSRIAFSKSAQNEAEIGPFFLRCIVENTNIEEASWKVEWCTEIFIWNIPKLTQPYTRPISVHIFYCPWFSTFKSFWPRAYVRAPKAVLRITYFVVVVLLVLIKSLNFFIDFDQMFFVRLADQMICYRI